MKLRTYFRRLPDTIRIHTRILGAALGDDCVLIIDGDTETEKEALLHEALAHVALDHFCTRKELNHLPDQSLSDAAAAALMEKLTIRELQDMISA